jgi:hypothetical protein
MRDRVAGPLLGALRRTLRQGVTPGRLAASVAVGLVVSVFPVVGTTTALCAAIALACRLNLVAIQAANYAAFPLQLALFVPLVRLGERVLGAPRLALAPAAVADAFARGAGHAARVLSLALWHAAVGWAVVAAPAALLLHAALRPALARLLTTSARAAPPGGPAPRGGGRAAAG